MQMLGREVYRCLDEKYKDVKPKYADVWTRIYRCYDEKYTDVRTRSIQKLGREVSQMLGREVCNCYFEKYAFVMTRSMQPLGGVVNRRQDK